MALLKVKRNRQDYQGDEYMYHRIDDIWVRNGLVRRYRVGIAGIETDDIFNEFCMVQQSYGKDPTIKIHEFVIDFEDITDEQRINGCVRNILAYLGQAYQCLAVISSNDMGAYSADFLINAVSPVTGRCFHDNNQTYVAILHQLQGLAGNDVQFEVSDGALFDSERGLRDSYRY